MIMKFITIGKMANNNLSMVEREYVKWISRFRKLEIVELKQVENHDDINKIISEQEDIILRHVSHNDFVCLLDLRGKELDSIEFSKHIDNWQRLGKEIVFIFGGSYGVGPKVFERANFCWCLSKLTFPHLLARILVLEQIFRAYKIINNQTYHK